MLSRRKKSNASIIEPDYVPNSGENKALTSAAQPLRKPVSLQDYGHDGSGNENIDYGTSIFSCNVTTCEY
jgi:hypothetical protein